LRIASSNNLEPHNILVQYEVVISSWQDPTSRSVSVDSWSLLMTILPSSKQHRIRSLLLHHGHKLLTSTGSYRFLSLSNRGPSRRSDGTGSVIRSSPITSQVEVELPTFTIAPLERSSELYWKLNAGSIEHGHGHALHQSARAESSLSMIEKGRVRGFL